MQNNQKDIEAYFKSLDRSLFIDNEYKACAHDDRPLPIGFEQTISQPSLVLEMTVQLDINKDCSVLEIGTGSGYQTAFLAELAKEVFTIERIEALAIKAQGTLKNLGFDNIFFKMGDGSEGWLEHAPFDRIIATAGAKEIPQELLKQLAIDGKFIIPIGEQEHQELLIIEKTAENKINIDSLGKVRFVEFKGKYGWDKLRKD